METGLSLTSIISFFCICSAYMPHDLISKVTNRTGVEVITWENCNVPNSRVLSDCLSCGVQVLCFHDDGSSAVAFTEECDPGQSCVFDNTLAVASSSCTNAGTNNPCDCPSNTNTRIDKTTNSEDDSWYIDCTDGDNPYKKCENGYFNEDEDVLKCVSCPQDGRIISKENCQEYITCKKSNDDLFIKSGTENCPDRQFVSDVTNSCVDRYGSFICIETGNFKDPFDCQRYQECTNELVKNSDFSSPKCCGKDEVFDQGTEQCVNDFSKCVDESDHKCRDEISPQYCHNQPTQCSELDCKAKPDEDDCHKYYYCEDSYYHSYKCYSDWVFDEDECNCLRPEETTCKYQ